jgi:hypothetical protein
VHAGACELLESCSASLAGSRELLLELVLALASDPWPQVAAPARAWLAAQAASDQALPPGGKPVADAVLGMVGRLLQGLLPAMQRGEDAGIMHARQLATALQARRTPAERPTFTLLLSLPTLRRTRRMHHHASLVPASRGVPWHARRAAG